MMDCTSSFQSAQLGHRHRVRDVRLPALPVLAQVRLVGKLECLAHQRLIGRLQVTSFSISRVIEMTCWRGGTAGCEVGPKSAGTTAPAPRR
jgi:hypothetical protein